MHTKGPWVYFVVPGEPNQSMILSDNGTKWVVAHMLHNGALPSANHSGDGLLLAAAPELLEACEDALYLIKKSNCSNSENVVKTLEVAIAKAKGS
jgi:hypothetical protein